MMRRGGNQVRHSVMVLTAKQRRLVRELEDACSELSLDFYDIKRY